MCVFGGVVFVLLVCLTYCVLRCLRVLFCDDALSVVVCYMNGLMFRFVCFPDHGASVCCHLINCVCVCCVIWCMFVVCCVECVCVLVVL